jgi:NTE family protein
VTERPAVGLVLGGGGVVGQAFHAGVLAALDEVMGFDARTAAIVVGTSAGATAGALIRGGLRGADLVARATGQSPAPDVAEILERYGPPIDVASLPRPSGFSLGRPAAPGRVLRAIRRPWGHRVGTLAGALIREGTLSPTLVSEPVDRLFGDRWPHEPFWVCVVRLDDGQRVVLRGDAVEGDGGDAPAPSVGTAVSASCAVPGWYSPVVIDGVRFVDGGLWSPTNADVLQGERLDAVIVSSPMSGRPADAPSRRDGASRQFLRRYLQREVAVLRKSGMPCLVIEPGRDDMAEMGRDLLDPERRAPVTERVKTTTISRLRGGDLGRRIEEMGLRWQ